MPSSSAAWPRPARRSSDEPAVPAPRRPDRRRTPPHESAFGHVTGSALYTDDLVGRLTGVLHAYPVQSTVAHARLNSLDVEGAYRVPGVVRVITAADIPGV